MTNDIYITKKKGEKHIAKRYWVISSDALFSDLNSAFRAGYEKALEMSIFTILKAKWRRRKNRKMED